MEVDSEKIPEMGNRTYSIQSFIKRVIITLIVLVAVSSTAVFLLIYLPLKTELERSLINNFDRVSYISYASLQNNIDRGLEGAKSLSSRTMIKNAILDYENGELGMDELIAYTQPRYEDGAKALEYLIKAERFVDDTIIAAFLSAEYKEHSCTTDERLIESSEVSSAFCLTDDHSYFAMLSPILSEGRVVGYDKLVFDLSNQVQMLSTDTVKPDLIYQEEFEDLSSSAVKLQSDALSSLFYREGCYCLAYRMQDSAYFISKQDEASLLEPVYRLSRQTLLIAIGVIFVFTLAIYLMVIRYAKGELVYLEDSRRSLKEAVAEANLDPLTKAGTRRFGEDFLISAFESYRKGEPSPAILLFDIDSLKNINDAYGHSVGDLVIRSIAEAVQMNVRTGDMLLRWGGDEFVGIFGGLRKENALEFAQKLLNTVSELTVETDTGTIRPTISIGISYFTEDDRGYIEAVNRADRAMYQSKTEGRNRANKQ